MLVVFVTCRSALPMRLIAVVAVLLLGVGSGVVLVMLTKFVIEPPAPVTTTVKVMLPVVPFAKLAVVSVKALVLVVNPTVPVLTVTVALTKVNPELIRSVKVIASAALGPALAKLMT